MFAFGGWNFLNYVTEELENPKRNLPLCLITGLLTVLFLYILVNVSYLAVMTKDEFLSSWAAGVSWAEHVIPSAVILVPIVVVCSVYGTLNGSSFASSRVCFAAAREGLFPEFLSYLNVHNNVPVPAICLYMVLSFIMIIPTDLTRMLNLIGFISWIFEGLIMVAHLILHFKMKDAERPFKVPIIIPIIVLLFVIYMVVAPFLKPVKTEFWYAIAFLLVGAVLFIPFVVFRLQLPGMDSVTKHLQMLMNVAPPRDYRPE